MSQALKGSHGGNVLDTAWSYISEEECAWILGGKQPAGRKFLQQNGTVDGQSYTWVVQYDHAASSTYSGFTKNRSSGKPVYPILNCTSDPTNDWNQKVTDPLEGLLKSIGALSNFVGKTDNVFIPKDTTSHSDLIYDDGTNYVSIHNKHNNQGGRWFALSGTRHSPGSTGSTPRGTFITQGLNAYSTALANAGGPRQMAAFVAAFNQSGAKGKAIRMGVFRHLEARSAVQGGNSHFVSTTNNKTDWSMQNGSVGPIGTFGVTAQNAHQLVMTSRSATMADISLNGNKLFSLQVRGRANAIVYDHHNLEGAKIMENQWADTVRKVLMLEEAEEQVSAAEIEDMSNFLLDVLDSPDEAPIDVDETSIEENAKRNKSSRIDESRWLKLAGLLKD